MEKTLPMILQWDESFDIGSDTLTGVNDADYKPPFPLTAKLNKLTIKVDRPQLSPEDIKKLEAAMRSIKLFFELRAGWLQRIDLHPDLRPGGRRAEGRLFPGGRAAEVRRPFRAC
jgi:hypothetical protein